METELLEVPEATTEGLQQARFLRIKNDGVLDIRLIALMGGTTKAENLSKIGQFGTGLKYAISYLVRNKNDFKCFIDGQEVVFEGREEVINDQKFTTVYMNGVSMNITTRYGYQWKAWEVLRELWCNAKDEGAEVVDVVDFEPVGLEGTTEFYIEFTEEIEDVFNNWDAYFLSGEPIFENENFAVYINPDSKLKLYKNRVLIHVSDYYKSKFLFDIKKANLNELRQYMGHVQSDIGRAILQSNKELIGLMMDDFKTQSWNQNIEFTLNYEYVSYDKNHVKEIFNGYLFLPPDSDRENNSQSIRVNQGLFDILQECGCPCEKVYSKRGRYYGSSGSGIEDNEKIKYTELLNSTLAEKIQKILDVYKSNLEFSVAMPKDSDFEMLIEDKHVLFSSDLINQSETDLKCVVLVAILQTREGNVFKAVKRLIKFAMSNKAFEKVFFGK